MFVLAADIVTVRAGAALSRVVSRWARTTSSEFDRLVVGCVRSHGMGQPVGSKSSNGVSSKWFDLLQKCVFKMLTSSSGSTTSILMVTSRHGQFGAASASGGRDGVVCGPMATAVATAIVNDAQHHPLTDLLGADKPADDLVQHNNNKAAMLTDLTSEVDLVVVSSPSHHRRRSSNKSGPSLLSATLTGSHKDQVGSAKEDIHMRCEST